MLRACGKGVIWRVKEIGMLTGVYHTSLLHNFINAEHGFIDTASNILIKLWCL